MNLNNPYLFFSILITSNVLSYGLTIIISKLWNTIYGYQETLSKQELLDSLVTLGLNIIIAVPGFILWRCGIIQFSDSNIILSFISAFLLMDFLMYVLHYLSHTISVLKKIHAKHHEHSEKFNCISLYYMSPWESILFGVLLTAIAVIFQFNIYGYIGFLVFNWLYGVITHLNGKAQSSSFLIFTTNIFHKNHHKLNYKNYGFYTFIWDKLFRTEK